MGNKPSELGSVLDDLKMELIDYLNKRLKWVSLLYQERGSKLFAVLLYGLLVLSIVFVILFFSLIGLALFIGRLLDDPFMGFLVLTLTSTLVLIVIILCRNKIKNYILNQSIAFMQGIDDDNEEIHEDGETEQE